MLLLSKNNRIWRNEQERSGSWQYIQHQCHLVIAHSKEKICRCALALPRLESSLNRHGMRLASHKKYLLILSMKLSPRKMSTCRQKTRSKRLRNASMAIWNGKNAIPPLKNLNRSIRHSLSSWRNRSQGRNGNAMLPSHKHGSASDESARKRDILLTFRTGKTCLRDLLLSTNRAYQGVLCRRAKPLTSYLFHSQMLPRSGSLQKL